MPIKYQNRRGTSTEANTITLSEGELYMDLTNKKLRIHDGILAGGYELARTSDLTSKQATLVSGTNIKTVNGTSILGSGDLSVTQLTLASEVNTPNALKDLKTNTNLSLQYGSLPTTQYKFSDEAGSILVYSSASGLNEFALTSALPATYEFWYYPSTAGTNEYIFSVLGQDNNSFSLDRTGGIYVSDNTDGNSGLSSNRSNSQITWGNWHHVAVYLSGSQVTIWFDGTKTETYSLPVTYQLSKARTAIRLGGHYSGWTKPDGYYGQVLVTSGDKYGASNNSITVPTSSFVTTANTPFLLKYVKAEQTITVTGKLTSTSLQTGAITATTINATNITATSISGNGSQLTGITSLGTITNKSVLFDTGISSTEYTGLKIKNGFCTYILGNNIPGSYNSTFFIHGDWLNTGTPNRLNLLSVDAQNSRIGINTQGPTSALDVNGTVKATLFSGNGSALTNLPSQNQSIWKASTVNWNYSIKPSNYTQGQFVTLDSSKQIYLTPSKSGTLEIIYYPGDAYLFTSVSYCYFTFNVVSGGTTYTAMHAFGNTTSTGSLQYGPFVLHVPVTSNSTITMLPGWNFTGANASADPWLYLQGNVDPSNRFITARYVDISNSSTF